MGFNRHLSVELNFVFTLLEGDVSDDMVRTHVQDLNREAAALSGMRELVQICADADMAPVTVKATYDAAQLEANQPRAVGGKLAICVTNDLHFGMARVYGAGSGGTRADFHVGYALDEALRWLAESAEDRAALIAFIKKHWPEAPPDP